MAGRLHLSQKSSLPPKHSLPPDPALSLSLSFTLFLFFLVRRAILCNPQSVSRRIISQPSSAGQLQTEEATPSQAIDISLHFYTPLTAAGLPAGQRERGKHSLIDSESALLRTPRGRCFTPIHTLINFLTRQSPPLPAVASPAPCPVARLLSKRRDV